jgi:hypothetical protein
MWLLRYLVFYMVLSVFGLTLILFLGQNVHTERIVFFGLEYTTNMVWVLVGAAAFGALIVLALLLPGRLAVTLHAWSVEREVRHAEQDMEHLQERRERLLARHEDLLEAYERLLQGHQRLVAEHSRTVAERDRMRSQLAAGGTGRVGGAGDATRATQVAAAPVAPPALTAPASTSNHITVPGLTIITPVSLVAADVESQPKSARGGRVPPAQGITPSSGAAAGTATERGRSLPAETAREGESNQLAPAESAAHWPTTVEEAPILPAAAAGRTGAAPASERPLDSNVPPTPTTEPLPPTRPVLPPPAKVAPAAPASANSSVSPPRPAIRSTDRINAFSARPLAELRDRLHGRLREDIANSAALIAALRGTVAAQLTRLKQLSLLDRLTISPTISPTNGPTNGPTSGTPEDLLDSNDPG